MSVADVPCCNRKADVSVETMVHNPCTSLKMLLFQQDSLFEREEVFAMHRSRHTRTSQTEHNLQVVARSFEEKIRQC